MGHDISFSIREEENTEATWVETGDYLSGHGLCTPFYRGLAPGGESFQGYSTFYLQRKDLPRVAAALYTLEVSKVYSEKNHVANVVRNIRDHLMEGKEVKVDCY